MNGDHAFLETLLDWRAAGHEVVLITVARTWGSSPRPAGSLMAWRDDGVTLGSVSGGCVEEDLLQRLARGELDRDRPLRFAYGTTRAEARRFGLPCGGRMELIIERLQDVAALIALCEALRAGRTLVRRLCLATGRVDLLQEGGEFYCDDTHLERRFGPAWQLVLVGAGDLARQLVHCAAHLDYQIVVCDPREEQQAHWDLPVALDPRMPDEVAADCADDARTAVITLTHDPRIDDLALMQALPGRAFYVGALGSRHTSEKRRERLLSLGLAPEDVARLHAPVGLAIGSRTPAEIALSILAEITAVRRALECAATPARTGSTTRCRQ